MSKIEIPKDALEEILSDVEIVRSIETLEYHDKNFLSGQTNTRSREKINMLTKIIETISVNLLLKGA